MNQFGITGFIYTIEVNSLLVWEHLNAPFLWGLIKCRFRNLPGRTTLRANPLHKSSCSFKLNEKIKFGDTGLTGAWILSTPFWMAFWDLEGVVKRKTRASKKWELVRRMTNTLKKINENEMKARIWLEIDFRFRLSLWWVMRYHEIFERMESWKWIKM